MNLTKGFCDLQIFNLNAEGKGNPGTAPGGLRKTSRVYFRKVDLTDGSELKASFGDVNLGNSATANIQGGAFKSIYYSNYTLPSKPSYGDSKFVGLYAGVPVVIGSKGVEKIVEMKLDEKEKNNFKISANAVMELFEAAKKIDPELVK